MTLSYHCRVLFLVAGSTGFLVNPQLLLAQVGKDKGVPKKEAAFAAAPLELKPGEPLSEMSLVLKPAPIRVYLVGPSRQRNTEAGRLPFPSVLTER